MYPHTKFGILSSNNYSRYATDTVYLELSRGQNHSDPKTVCDTLTLRYVYLYNKFGFLPQIKLQICCGHIFTRTKARDQGHNDPETVCHTPHIFHWKSDKILCKTSHIHFSNSFNPLSATHNLQQTTILNFAAFKQITISHNIS